jgi:acyl-CoA thioesterase-1
MALVARTARDAAGVAGTAALIAAALLGPAAVSAAPAGPGTILVYGDSLSAAYGISQKEGWATLLQERLRKSARDYTVVNASISGETSSGGASRIAETLARHKPKITIVALGANDGLRGLPVKQMRDNLAAIIDAAQKAGSKVVLVGMRMPPNYGPDYTRAFEAAYAQLAKQFRLPAPPFLLDGIADKQSLFQPDQLHPIAEAQPRLLDNVWKALRTLL